MLSHLSIRDFVLVDRLEIPFHTGMTVLTGETGAGKSILVDALSLVLGGRAESGMVRQGAKKAEISAEFDLGKLPAVQGWLKANDLESNSYTCSVRRIVEAGGRSRAFINGVQVTLNQLRELGEQLVDIHGQHAHHALLRPSVQRELLDEYAGAHAEVSETLAAWQAWQTANKRLQAAKQEAEAKFKEKEELETATAEVAPLFDDLRHWDELQLAHQRQANMSNLIASSAKLVTWLDDEESGLLHQLNQLRSLLLDMQAKDASLAAQRELIDNAISNLEELRHALSRYADRLSLDQECLSDLDRRIAEVLRISRKYRLSPAELLIRQQEWRDRLTALTASQAIDELEKAVQRAEKNYRLSAGKLSAKRREAAKTLSEAVTLAMSELALSDGRFAVNLKPCEPHAYGLEEIEFLVSSHASLPVGLLDKVASGGELSRISLAIQTARSGAAGVPTLIFDEVDVGIGGGVAEAVGRRLAQLASGKQVLVITHFPQVAAFGHHHLRVSKLAEADQVISRVEALDEEERVSEIARMLGGREMTRITLKHAREMLSSANFRLGIGV